MTEFLSQYHIAGPVIGLATFIIIGLFHPLVIWGEYYWGLRCRWVFLAAGIITLALCFIVSDFFFSALLGVTAFSCFWSIKEISDQRKRVLRGWFPRNPRRNYGDNA